MYRQTNYEQIEQPRSPKWWRMMSVVIIALVFGVLMRATLLLAAPSAAPAAANLGQSAPDDGGDDEPEDEYIIRYGVIIERPDVKEGTWVISKTTSTAYQVTDGTDIEEELGEGTCVEVKSLVSNPSLAKKIREADAFHCEPEGDGDGDGDPEEEFIVRIGVITTRPGEKVGTWVISGTTVNTYTATSETHTEGTLEVGRCVAIKSLESSPTVAWRILEQDGYKCGAEHEDDEDDYIIRFGELITRPAGTAGPWVIEGLTFSANEETEVDEEHGALEVGVCVKVKLPESNPTVAKEIESENDYKCSGSDDGDNAEGTLYGVIMSLPPILENGIWNIGGISFSVVPTTELVSNAETFTKGLTVKVDFVTNMNDTNTARRIEIKFGNDNPCREHNDGEHHDDEEGNDPDHDGGGDHDGDEEHHRYGHCFGRDGKTFGRIDQRPSSGLLTGDWVIGGVRYSADARTIFHHDDDFLAGERVKVEYIVVNTNLRRITRMMEVGLGDNPNGSLIVGYVMTKPVAFVGKWWINGAPFEAVSTTDFIERGSLFAVGAYVVVNYEIVDDRRLIHRILTYVPPGAGDDNSVGTLEAIGGVVATAASVPMQSNEVWTVDGVDYIVSEATQLVENSGDVAVGDIVFVNSYTADGQRYATLIRAQANDVFMPMAGR